MLSIVDSSTVLADLQNLVTIGNLLKRDKTFAVGDVLLRRVIKYTDIPVVDRIQLFMDYSQQ